MRPGAAKEREEGERHRALMEILEAIRAELAETNSYLDAMNDCLLHIRAKT
jgi:hypothetical protein